MFWLNLLQAFRALKKDVLFSAINIIGMSLGLVSCGFIFLYTYHSLTFDHYHEDVEQIFRITSTWMGEKDKQSMTISSHGVGPYLADNYSFIESSCRISYLNEQLKLTHGPKEFILSNFRPAEADILDVFTFKFIEGDRKTIKNAKSGLIINKIWALKIFGTTQCIGETVHIEDQTHEIKGVFETWPQNIDFPIEGVIIEDYGLELDWEKFAYYTYVKTTRSSNHGELSKALMSISEEYFHENEGNAFYIIFEAQPLNGLHFTEVLQADTPKGNIAFVYFFLAAGIILVLVVFLNIINLGVIKSIEEVKSLGIRKILGAKNLQLTGTFYSQLILLFILSILIGATFLQPGRYIFKEVTGIELELFSVHGIILILTVILFFILTIMSGVYSLGFILLIQPINALKNKITGNLPAVKSRKIMVALQFIISGILLSGLNLLIAQWNFISNKEMGFDSSRIMIIDFLKDSEIDPLHHELSNAIGYENVSKGGWGSLPQSQEGLFFQVASFPDHPNITKQNVFIQKIDSTFLDIFNISVNHGHKPLSYNQEIEFKGPRIQVLVNQSLADLLGNPIGTQMNLDGWLKTEIIGVFQNYHFQSLHNPIQPQVFIPANSTGEQATYLFIRIGNYNREKISSLINKHLDPAQYELYMLDDKLLSNYGKEKEAIWLFSYFSVLCIVISYLGIFGIISYVLKRRIFEIGIRKVLGANIYHLIRLFGREILFILGLSLLFIMPLSAILKKFFFGLYAYHPDLKFYWLIIPNLISILLAFVIITIKIKIASTVNPSFLLKEE